MATLPVKWFESTMEGAPQLHEGAPGELIALLDACLLNGFNLREIAGLTYDAGAGTCTASFANGHGYVVDQVVLIEGAAEDGFNGEHRVLSVTANTFTFAPATPPAASAATGALTAKAAPIGQWEKLLDDGSGTRAVYRSTDPAASGCCLYVDDRNEATGWNYSSARWAHVFGAERAVDLETWEGEFGYTPPAASSDGWWRKASSEAGGRHWGLIGDGRLFYYWVNSRQTSSPADSNWSAGRYIGCYAFGDFEPFNPADPGPCMLISGDNRDRYDGRTNLARLDTSVQKYLARDYGGLSSSVAMSMVGHGLSVHLGYTGLSVPNPADNGIYIHAPVLVRESSSGPIRGAVPGIYQLLHTAPFPHVARVAGLEAAPDKKLWAVLTASASGSSYSAQVLFDLYGPWR